MVQTSFLRSLEKEVVVAAGKKVTFSCKYVRKLGYANAASYVAQLISAKVQRINNEVNIKLICLDAKQ